MPRQPWSAVLFLQHGTKFPPSFHFQSVSAVTSCGCWLAYLLSDWLPVWLSLAWWMENWQVGWLICCMSDFHGWLIDSLAVCVASWAITGWLTCPLGSTGRVSRESVVFMPHLNTVITVQQQEMQCTPNYFSTVTSKKYTKICETPQPRPQVDRRLWLNSNYFPFWLDCCIV